MGVERRWDEWWPGGSINYLVDGNAGAGGGGGTEVVDATTGAILVVAGGGGGYGGTSQNQASGGGGAPSTACTTARVGTAHSELRFWGRGRARRGHRRSGGCQRWYTDDRHLERGRGRRAEAVMTVPAGAVAATAGLVGGWSAYEGGGGGGGGGDSYIPSVATGVVNGANHSGNGDVTVSWTTPTASTTTSLSVSPSSG